jgi:hypothetical protein
MADSEVSPGCVDSLQFIQRATRDPSGFETSGAFGAGGSGNLLVALQ